MSDFDFLEVDRHQSKEKVDPFIFHLSHNNPPHTYIIHYALPYF